jgi:hypothetical protein
MKKEMNPEEESRFRKQYGELADYQIAQMLSEGREAYVEGAYELLQEEASRREIKIEEERVIENSREEPIEATPEQPSVGSEVDLNTYAQIIIVNHETDRAYIQTILEKSDIPYFFQNLNIRRDVDLPSGLMVENPRVVEAVDLLKDFKPINSIILW